MALMAAASVRVGVGGDGFHRVGQCVHTGGCGEGSGHAHHEPGSLMAMAGGDPPVYDGHLHLPVVSVMMQKRVISEAVPAGGVHGHQGGRASWALSTPS